MIEYLLNLAVFDPSCLIGKHNIPRRQLLHLISVNSTVHILDMPLHEPKLLTLLLKLLHLCLIFLNHPVKLSFNPLKAVNPKQPLNLRQSHINLPVQINPHYFVYLFIPIIPIPITLIPHRTHQTFLLIQSDCIRRNPQQLRHTMNGIPFHIIRTSYIIIIFLRHYSFN